MKEIGGYLELDTFSLPMLHEGAIALNCCRNALAYALLARKAKSVWLPWFLCDSERDVCAKYGIPVKTYRIGEDFLPEEIAPGEGEWLCIVNYYGQLSQETLLELKNRYGRILVDNTQAYFQPPLEGVDTIYSCRKFFGVSDGGFLYTDARLEEELERDESFERIRFVLGRYERTASEFYAEAAANNDVFIREPIKKMSRLTENLLHAIDYDAVRRRRTENFAYLDSRLGSRNRLRPHPAEGAFMYPLWSDRAPELRRSLAKEKIYIPTLWPDVLARVPEDWTEWRLANFILPLPVDQRYTTEDMEHLAERLLELGI